MNDLQKLPNPFDFWDQTIRTAVDETGEVWFCAKDVFRALDIVWKGAKGSLMNCPEKWQVVWYLQTSYGQKETIFISEAAVYQTSFRSNKPKAMEFTEWVCSEVLPSIRKQGFFGTIPAQHRLGYSRQIVSVSEKLAHTKDAMVHQMLTSELRDLCNLVGRAMPDMTLLGSDYKQLSLPELSS